MKFSEIQYKRPGLDTISKELDTLAQKAESAPDGEALLKCFDAYRKISDSYSTGRDIAYIRHSVDTRDEFYDGENDYFDEQGPVIADKCLKFYRSVLASAYKDALATKYGEILLKKMELAVKSSDERLISLQQQENNLISQYEKLYAAAKIPFDGKEYTVAQLGLFKQNPDRDIRKRAIQAEGEFFDSNRNALDQLYDQLVKNRSRQAKLLGFDSFTPLGDIRMERLGYGRPEITACREYVARDIVPLVCKLKKAQAKRLGLPALKYYDDVLSFPDGNPVPHGTPEEILSAGQAMYRELSPETAEFIDFMMENELFDVLAKPGKAPGGYCTQIADYKAPFIFSNFNGTSGDVDVLTHEAGHAFAAYRALRKELPPELANPGMESCEIHSMSMEFLTAPYHHLFFKEDTEKYSFSHTEDALYFLPYGCQVDEFQEKVYENPEMSPEERNELWLKLEKKYRPWNDFDALPFYSRGAGWQRQMHIYTSPFYYIDYVLAQSVALQFFISSRHDSEQAWKQYLTLLEKAGTGTYPQLVEAAGMGLPYKDGVLREVGTRIFGYLQEEM